MMRLFTGVFAITLLAVTSTTALANNGATLFQENCASCHVGEEGASKRIAPPTIALKTHYLPVHKTKEEFTSAFVRWVKAPTKESSLMPGAIGRFELMAAVDIEEADIKKIATFIYDSPFDVPDWYRQHYREEHGVDPITGK